jgi:rubrerythrin
MQQIKKLIEDAIYLEKRAYEDYASLSRSAINKNQEQFFVKIALQELKHQHLLELFLETKDFMEAKIRLEKQYLFERFKIVDDLPDKEDGPSLDEGFKLAIDAEVDAQHRYAILRDQATTSSAQQLFTFLHDEEHMHEQLFRKEYDNYLLAVAKRKKA